MPGPAGSGDQEHAAAPSPGGDDPSAPACPRCRELQAEVEHLRARVARLEADKAALLRRAAERDYERPPHYQ